MNWNLFPLLHTFQNHAEALRLVCDYPTERTIDPLLTGLLELFRSPSLLICGTALWDRQWRFGFLLIWRCECGTSNKRFERCGSSSEGAMLSGDVYWLHFQFPLPHPLRLERIFNWVLKLCSLQFRRASHGLFGTYTHVWEELEQQVTL